MEQSLTGISLRYIFTLQLILVGYTRSHCSFWYALQALTRAWKEACAAGGTSKIVIPKTTYNLGNPASLQGPCKGPIEIRLDGTLKAPANPRQLKGDGWITIGRVDGFTLSGSGTLDGQGATSWKQNDCGINNKCKLLATVKFLTNSCDRIIYS
jgi:galacturan 1,4-alpha-galacturonidase